MNLDELLARINNYSNEEKRLILRAYSFACYHHKGQTRKCGEEYIIHPTAVGCILAEMHADAETICAGLLHDTIEDCKGVTKELITEEFNETIADLVDGVTKIRREGDSSNEEENMHKIIDSITKDVRIFIIKLADRLHNMRTMDYQDPEKQVKKSKETLELYVPIAFLLGQYTIKSELEDLAFKYLYQNDYNQFLTMVNNYEKKQRDQIDQVLLEISMMLNELNVQNNILFRRKNLLGVYRKYDKYKNLSRIHDMFALKVLLPSNEMCYEVKDKVSDMYKILQNKDKDYIAYPKNNRYMGLHTSIYLPESGLLQLQFKTPEMYNINAYGITAYWDFKDKKMKSVNEIMQDEVKGMPFYQTLVELGNENLSSEEYNQIVRSDILTRMIYLEGINGVNLELPEGSTPVDYAFYINPLSANYIDYALVNGRWSPINYPLESRDKIEIIYGKNTKTPEELINSARCMQTKRKILKK